MTKLFILALAAGVAGMLSFTMGLAGAIIGVTVAVALLPPLVVCSILLVLIGLVFITHWRS